ncbi:hypothetical protein [Thalassobaculum sp.]|uniref:hypothetical protein n=1 Tax=Thalassobaculum sp. TaxID=2022740 RepID=UPI0032EBF7D3
MIRRILIAAAGGLLAAASLAALPAAAATTSLTCGKAETSFLKPAEGARSGPAVPMTVYTGCPGFTEVALVLDPTAKTRPAGARSFVRYCGSAVSPAGAKSRTDVWSYCSNSLTATGDESYWIVVK